MYPNVTCFSFGSLQEQGRVNARDAQVVTSLCNIRTFSPSLFLCVRENKQFQLQIIKLETTKTKYKSTPCQY